MNLLYSALLAAAVVVTSPVWLLRMVRQGKYRAGLAERLGRVPARLHAPQRRPAIWVHAVSVGELLAVGGLIAELQQRLPSHRLVISTTTATGQKLARERFGGENVFYFPLDFAFAIRPYLRTLRPELVIVAETEFWPNFFRLARRAGARVAVINARISDRSLPRYRAFRAFLAPVLDNLDLLLAQSDEDRRRLLAIGAPEERVQVGGNLKFDLKPAAESAIVASLRQVIERQHAGPVLVCGSTVEGEEELLLRAFESVRERYPSAVMILAPRHPERFDGVARLLASTEPALQRRSQWEAKQPLAGGIFLLDTIGELASLYALADVAFVGGSLAPKGGHNILEAAQHGAAIVVGPYTENFRDIIALFQRGGAVEVADAGSIATTILGLLGDESRRRALGVRAREILHANAGATARTLAALQSLLAGRPAAASEPARAPVQT